MSQNPPCACGCGNEVRHPRNKWIIGHSSKRKLTDQQVKEIVRYLELGVSQYLLAEVYGVSQATIAKFSWQDCYSERSEVNWHSRELIRQEDLNQIQENKQWRKGKKILKQLKRTLRNPQNLREAVLQQERTSQT